jgi:hypothetical protein
LLGTLLPPRSSRAREKLAESSPLPLDGLRVVPAESGTVEEREVSTERSDLEERNGAEQLDQVELDEADDVDDLEDVEALEDDEDEAEGAAEEDSESDQASWEELLAQRAASTRTSDDPDDVAEIMAMSSEPRDAVRERLPTKVAPVRDRQEFVCKRCHLVKPRTQLADEERGLCRDCA